MKGSSKVFGKKSAEALKDETKKAFLSRLAAQVGKGVADAPDRVWNGVWANPYREVGAGGDPSTSEAHQEAFNAAMQGAIGGAAYGTAGGAINTVFGEETQAAPVDETTPQIENPPGPPSYQTLRTPTKSKKRFSSFSLRNVTPPQADRPQECRPLRPVGRLGAPQADSSGKPDPDEGRRPHMAVVTREQNQIRSDMGLPVSSTMAEYDNVSVAPGATRSQTLLPDETQTAQSRPQASYGTIPSENEGALVLRR